MNVYIKYMRPFCYELWKKNLVRFAPTVLLLHQDESANTKEQQNWWVVVQALLHDYRNHVFFVSSTLLVCHHRFTLNNDNLCFLQKNIYTI